MIPNATGAILIEDSPLGPLGLALRQDHEEQAFLLALWPLIPETQGFFDGLPRVPCHNAPLLLEGILTRNLSKLPPLDLQGTPFQREVWMVLMGLPEGVCCSYKDIAEQIGKPKAYRAVGNAVGRNPMAWLIPCHRVLPRSGSLSGNLGGFRWGVSLKERFLNYEEFKKR